MPTVVIVDDAPELRAVVKVALAHGGLDVVGEGATGIDAISLAEACRPDLLLLDVSMPKLDGLQALPLIRGVSPETAVVLYSGLADAGLAGLATERGAAAYLHKSAPIDRLAEELLEALAGTCRNEVRRGPGLPAGRGGAPARHGTGGADRPHDGESSHAFGEHPERFRQVFEDAAIGMATMTLTGRLVSVNRALAELIGVPAEDLVGVEYVSVVGEPAADAFAAALDRVLLGGPRPVAQVDHDLTGCGEPRRVRAILAPVLDRARRPLYLLLQLRDVSTDLATAERLQESERRFRLLLEAVQDYAIFMLDPDGNIASWNTGAQRIKGYSAEEAIGCHFRIFYTPEQQAARHPEHELQLALRNGRYEEEGWRVRKDGSRFWASVVITAVRDASGRHIGFGKVTRDVTERRALLDKLESLNAELARTSAEQASFLSMTAHELRGPVGMLAASADLLVDQADVLRPEEQRELLAALRSSAARARRLLDDLLTVSRLDAGRVQLQLSEIDVAEVLELAASTARRESSEVAIELDCPAGTAVRADRDRLSQMLENLVGNALQHGAAPVVLRAGVRDGSMILEVVDAGPGVPPELSGRLFERFATGDPGRGTGLGLLIVRELARAHGGDAWYGGCADGAGGRPVGAVFVLSLPLAATPACPRVEEGLP